MTRQFFLAIAVTLAGCASVPTVPAPRFYAYWEPLPNGAGVMGTPTSYYTELFESRGPNRKFFDSAEKDFYDAARGDIAAFHRFLNSPDRDADGAPDEGWSADMVILALVYKDSRIAKALRNEPQTVREEVGRTIEDLLPRDRNQFERTRTLYEYRKRPNHTLQRTEAGDQPPSDLDT